MYRYTICVSVLITNSGYFDWVIILLNYPYVIIYAYLLVNYQWPLMGKRNACYVFNYYKKMYDGYNIELGYYVMIFTKYNYFRNYVYMNFRRISLFIPLIIYNIYYIHGNSLSIFIPNFYWITNPNSYF